MVARADGGGLRLHLAARALQLSLYLQSRRVCARPSEHFVVVGGGGRLDGVHGYESQKVTGKYGAVRAQRRHCARAEAKRCAQSMCNSKQTLCRSAEIVVSGCPKLRRLCAIAQWETAYRLCGGAAERAHISCCASGHACDCRCDRRRLWRCSPRVASKSARANLPLGEMPCLILRTKGYQLLCASDRPAGISGIKTQMSTSVKKRCKSPPNCRRC